MEWADAKEILDQVIAALDCFDWSEVERICRGHDDSLLQRLENTTVPFPSDEGRALLRELRRKRRFELMGILADALIRSGSKEAEFRRQNAQALIDQGILGVAEKELVDLIASDPPAREHDEALGLLGRIYKQLYVNADQPSSPRQQRNILRGISFYFEAFSRNRQKNIWQGINYVALLRRAKDDGVDVSEAVGDGEIVLDQVEAELKRRKDADGDLLYWDRAINLEAAVARDQPEKAIEALYWYLRDKTADAFEFASTLRQLREVWRIPAETSPGDAIINGLKGAALKRGGDGVEVKSSEIRNILQKNFSGEADLPLNWLRTGLKRCMSIAQIISETGRRVGTGFLINGADFFENLDGEPILLTNWHVVSEDGEDPFSVAPEGTIAYFEASGGAATKIALKEVVAFCRRLDASFVRLEPVDPEAGHCPIRVPPIQFEPPKKQRLYLIGYPGGRGLSFSLHDSFWLDTDGTKLHYRTPAEGGNSGSPVFDENDWKLVGLHHGGSKDLRRLNNKPGTYDANEGLSIAAIQAAIRVNRRS